MNLVLKQKGVRQKERRAESNQIVREYCCCTLCGGGQSPYGEEKGVRGRLNQVILGGIRGGE